MLEHKREKVGSDSGCCWLRHEHRMDQDTKTWRGVLCLRNGSAQHCWECVCLWRPRVGEQHGIHFGTRS